MDSNSVETTIQVKTKQVPQINLQKCLTTLYFEPKYDTLCLRWRVKFFHSNRYNLVNFPMITHELFFLVPRLI